MIAVQVEFKEVKQAFPAFDNKLINDIVKNSSAKEFSEGEELIKSGQNIKSTMLVLDGLIKIFRQDASGHEIFMYHLEAGQACALSIICATQYRTSEIKAVSVQKTQVLAIPVKHVEQWIKEHSSWYQFILSTYRSRFEELLNTIDAIAFKNMDERLVLYLKKHQQLSGRNVISLTHTQIATELSTSREVISRLLKKLAEKGFIKVNRQNIELINLNYFAV